MDAVHGSLTVQLKVWSKTNLHSIFNCLEVFCMQFSWTHMAFFFYILLSCCKTFKMNWWKTAMFICQPPKDYWTWADLHDALLYERRRVVDQDEKSLRLNQFVHHLLQQEVRQQEQNSSQQIVQTAADQNQTVFSTGPEWFRKHTHESSLWREEASDLQRWLRDC